MLIGGGSNTLLIRPPTDSTASIRPPTDTEELVVRDHSELAASLAYLQQGGANDKDWVWLDGITLLEEIGMDDVFQHAIDQKPSRAEHGPDKGEYGVNRQRLMKWVRDVVGLSERGMFNFGITAQPFTIYDPVLEDDIWMPSVGPGSGTLSIKLCGYMQIVAYLRVVHRDGKAARRVLYTEHSGFYGKDQLTEGGLNELANPTMPKIEAILKGTGKGTSRKRPRRRARNK